ncbi:hypothetical protein MVEN_00137600 [Mycena venus]|uniref:NACHT domain-containing protein n=1 Tax=Mycena venus TaxID=2733690 RepID=A0A8H7DBC3_9AGAR|nr:hypothetical protein MVEN_00137600 [Mycena venus]
MSDHPKQPKPNPLDKPENPSQSAMQAPIWEESSPGATAVLPSDAESSLRRADNREDSAKRGDTAKTHEPDTVHLPGGVILKIYGGIGGAGGAGTAGGSGGTGEGPRITFEVNGTFKEFTFGIIKQSIKEKLTGHVAVQHKFTDQSKSLCAAGTRVDIQADILKWLLPQPGTKERIFWITGIAGSGKSTLSATVIESLRKNKEHTPVAAQFFISRNIPETINPDKIIPTIALQLAEFSPVAAGIIHDVLERGFPATREKQVEELLLAPIQELCKSCDVVIILIDALDELENAADSVKEILESIAPRGCGLPDNIRFIVTSRPEHWADISGSKTLELAVFEQHPLTTDSSMAEVHNFIIARIGEIKPKDWDGWPTQDELLELSTKADGLFHYAATALQWIKEQIHKHKKSCRSWVFTKLTQMGGLDPLKDLYRLILTSFEDIDHKAQEGWLRENRLRGFQQVIGTILVLDQPLTIRQITALLADIPEGDFDVANFLEQFRSVLIPGSTTSFEEATPQVHKSFRDYIMNGHAPEEFRILTGHAHFVTARSCLEVIVEAGNQSSIVQNYSVQHWYRHLEVAVKEGTTFDDRMWNLFEKMVQETAINRWANVDLLDLFVRVAIAGWVLLKVRLKYGRWKGDNYLPEKY